MVGSESLQPVGIGLVITFLVLSLGVHEAAHGWAALKCGDTTARDMGRITLNPFAHIDLFMTILVPLGCFILMGFPFGGAKPVPVNFHNLRKPHRDMALVALAGPASNVILAAGFFLLRKLLVQEFGIWAPGTIGDEVLYWAVYLNLLLAAFNLLPIPPLDGSRVMTWLLPPGLREPYMRLESIGLIIVIISIQAVPQVGRAVMEMIEALWRLIEYVVTLGGAW